MGHSASFDLATSAGHIGPRRIAYEAEDLPRANAVTAARVPTYCALCISRCGCLATVDDNRLIKVERDPDHPTGGAICVKAKTAPEFVHHPRRLTTPLIRTNPKGSADPGFRPASWDEALALTSQKVNAIAHEDGPDAVAFAVTTPSGTAIADSFAWIHRLAHFFGSPNLVFATENCNWHKDFTPALTWGAGIGMPDFARSGLILLWGFNPPTSWLSQVAPIKEAQRNGAKLVVIDPRRQGLARNADLWLGLRPGTDGALALGLAFLLLSRGAEDDAFLRIHSDAAVLVRSDTGRVLTAAEIGLPTDGNAPVVWDTEVDAPVPLRSSKPECAASTGRFRIPIGESSAECRTVLDLLRDRTAQYPPDRVSEITGLSIEQIQQLANWLPDCGPVSFFTWTGTAQHSNATQTTRALNVLYALTGSLDAPGGNAWFRKPSVRDVSAFENVAPATASLTLGLEEHPIGPPRRGWITTRDLFRTIVTGDPYPIRALVSFGGNFTLTKPRTRHAGDALKSLDFFVMTELFDTPSSKEADVILPVASCWERSGLQAGFAVTPEADRWIQLRPAVVSPRGESRSDTEIVFQLAERLGLGKHFFGGDVEKGLRHVLEPTDVSIGSLRANPRGVRMALADNIGQARAASFATSTGRVELYSSAMAETGEDPLPTYDPPLPNPERSKRNGFPLRLTCAKWPQFCHSQQRQESSITRSMPEPLVQLHPLAAASRGIKQGDNVEIVTPDGRVDAVAQVTADVRSDTVCAQYGWWDVPSRSTPPGLSYNEAIDGEVFDPPSGSNAMRSYVCEVNRCP